MSLEELNKHLEIERMRLSACGVAALSNTGESIKRNRIYKQSPYWSASYQDVCDAVDREISWRELYEQKRQDYSTLQQSLIDVAKCAIDQKELSDTLAGTLEASDEILSVLEDHIHGKEGEEITVTRRKIIEALTNYRNKK